MTLSPHRRTKTRRSEPTQQLIVFRILQEWFALPIRAAYKVIPIGQVYGIYRGGVGLMRYQERDVLVIDVQQRIFAESVHPPMLEGIASSNDAETTSPHYLLLIQSIQGELIGIPLDTFPCLRRVPESAFAPVPPLYLAEGRVRCVSALITFADEPPTFLLNLSQLVENKTGLPAVTEPS